MLGEISIDQRMVFFFSTTAELSAYLPYLILRLYYRLKTRLVYVYKSKIQWWAGKIV